MTGICIIWTCSPLWPTKTARFGRILLRAASILNNEGYNVWREFLVTHTAYSKENPYLPGSPYYTAPAA